MEIIVAYPECPERQDSTRQDQPIGLAARPRGPWARIRQATRCGKADALVAQLRIDPRSAVATLRLLTHHLDLRGHTSGLGICGCAAAVTGTEIAFLTVDLIRK